MRRMGVSLPWPKLRAFFYCRLAVIYNFSAISPLRADARAESLETHFQGSLPCMLLSRH